MADPAATPPKPPTPKGAAKGLGGIFKGKPAWVWIAGITVLLGVAYMARRRSLANAETGDVISDTPTSGDATAYPSETQGSFGGYDSFGGIDTSGDANDNAGAPETPPIIINIPGPTDTSAVDSGINPSGPDPSIAKGGAQASVGVSQHQPVQTPLQKALAKIQAVQASTPAVKASAAQQATQAKAAAAPNIFTQDNGSRSGLNYQLVQKNKKWYRFYESKPGKGDWGNGGKVLRP